MKTNESKLLMGLIIGAAVGTAIGYLLHTNKREEFIEEVNSTVDKAKRKIGDAINQGIEELDIAVDKVNTLAQTALSRLKATEVAEMEEK